jgi:molybdenum cofactor guanylyltransferase
VNRAPIYGLVLAGGTSTRMRRDKAALEYQGATQLDRAFDIVVRHSVRSFVSVRAGQAQDPIRAAKPLIIDSVDGDGPIVGILSAMAAYPDAAWLVLACDLPFLSDVTVEGLFAERDASACATAYRSARDGLPEPLCAIWEPRAAQALAAFQRAGGHCPRKFLLGHPTRLLEAVEAAALENVNTPDQYDQAQARLGRGGP